MWPYPARMSLRQQACDQYLALRPRERALLKERFTDSPGTLARIAMYEHHETTGEPLSETDGAVFVRRGDFLKDPASVMRRSTREGPIEIRGQDDETCGVVYVPPAAKSDDD